MRTRIIAVVVAAVLAIAGAAALVFAVQGASQSATAGTRTQSVLVVVERIPAGTPGDQVGERVEERDIPVAYLADGVVSDRDLLDGLVALVALEPGEQLIGTRWGPAAELVASGGRVEVQARVDAGDLVLAVADDGVGIPEPLRDRLFTKFGLLGDKRDGHGLGLYFVRLAAEAHGGDVRVEATPGGGATFVVRLPGPKAPAEFA